MAKTGWRMSPLIHLSVLSLFFISSALGSSRRFHPDRELSGVVTKMWNLDKNKCTPGSDYRLDLQGYVTSTHNMNRDWARRPLFSNLDDRVLQRKTYQAFINLLDNYEMPAGLPEKITDQEYQENVRFIDLIMETPVMKEVHSFLVSKRKAPKDVNDFKRL